MPRTVDDYQKAMTPCWFCEKPFISNTSLNAVLFLLTMGKDNRFVLAHPECYEKEDEQSGGEVKNYLLPADQVKRNPDQSG